MTSLAGGAQSRALWPSLRFRENPRVSRCPVEPLRAANDPTRTLLGTGSTTYKLQGGQKVSHAVGNGSSGAATANAPPTGQDQQGGGAAASSATNGGSGSPQPPRRERRSPDPQQQQQQTSQPDKPRSGKRPPPAARTVPAPGQPLIVRQRDKRVLLPGDAAAAPESAGDGSRSGSPGGAAASDGESGDEGAAAAGGRGRISTSCIGGESALAGRDGTGGKGSRERSDGGETDSYLQLE
jgi:hypothetical protein